MRKMFAVLFAICLICTSSLYAAVICVDDDGSGDGSAWNNSLADIPATLTRGDTVYVADGDYGGHTFSTAVSGTAKISILKADSTNHGPATGWDDSLGDGQAVFDSSITFTTDHWVFDGKYRTSVNSGHGFKIDVSSYASETTAIIIDEVGTGNASYITILYTEILGEWGTNASRPLDAHLSADGPDSLYFAYNYVHEFSKGLYWNGVDHTIFEHNMVANIAGDELGSHGGSMPLYYNTVQSLIIRYNHFKNIEGTGVVVVGLNSGTADSLFIYGNIFYNESGYTLRDTGLASLFWVATPASSNIRFYNNTIVNAEGNLIEVALASGTTSTFAYNNVWYITSKAAIYGWTNHAYNRFYNTEQAFGNVTYADSLEYWETDVPVPFVDWTNGDFRPVPETALTDSGKVLPDGWGDTDMYGSSLDGIVGALSDTSAAPAADPRTSVVYDGSTAGGSLADSLAVLSGADSGIVYISNLTSSNATSISITTNNTILDFSGTNTLDGRQTLSSWDVVATAGGGVTDSTSYRPGADGDDSFTHKGAVRDSFYYSENDGNGIAHTRFYDTDGDRVQFTFTGVPAGATIDYVYLDLYISGQLYGEKTWKIWGQLGELNAITDTLSFEAAFAETTTTSTSYVLTTGGAAQSYVLHTITLNKNIIQEMVDDAGYTDNKLRVLLKLQSHNGAGEVALVRDFAESGANDSLATLRVTYTTTGGEADTSVSKEIGYVPRYVWIDGEAQHILVGTGDDSLRVDAVNDTVVMIETRLYVAPADTASVTITGNIGIDNNGFTGTIVRGGGGLFIRSFTVPFDSIQYVERARFYQLQRYDGADSSYRITVTNADSLNGVVVNSLFLPPPLSEGAENLTATYSMFDEWDYLPSGTGNDSINVSITGYDMDDYQDWSLLRVPYGYSDYLEGLITVTSPDSGEVWNVGSSHNITWTSTNVDSVKIYFNESGGDWTLIVTDTDGSPYAWTIPDSTGTTMKVRIISAINTAVYDDSGNYFTIQTASTTTATTKIMEYGKPSKIMIYGIPQKILSNGR